MSNIFKAYDIRGAYPGELDEEIARKIGAAFIAFLQAEKIVVGYDMRISSPALKTAFIDAAIDSGADVIDIGMVTTPLLYYALIAGKYDGGAMVTASHLPAVMNGLKLCRKEAVPLSRDQGLPILEKMIAEPALPGKHKGRYQRREILSDYIDQLCTFVKNPEPLRMVIDVGNGIAGPEVAELLRRVPAWQATTLYMEPDGRFPHHVANPLIVENTAVLQKRVQQEKADIGIAFDGDADRCGFIDEQGNRIREDLITALIAEYYLTEHPGGEIIYDLRSSRVVPETIGRMGGIAVRSRVGHSFIKERMRGDNALFAGELSGHYYYKDTGFTDNALFTMIRMLGILSKKKEKLSKIMAAFETYCASGEINLKTTKDEAVYRDLERVFRDADQDHLDGLTITLEDWWFNLRASNTEPLMRLNLEAMAPDMVKQRLNDVLTLIRKADPDLEVIN